jgi:hypothetical protein
MAKDYNSINFKNKDIDKFSTKFGQANGDPKKKEPEGTKNPEYLNVEKGSGPYSTKATVNNTTLAEKRGYGPKSGYKIVDKGELSKQDSLDVNANRPPNIGQLTLVSQEMKKGTKFPGLSPEFKQSLKTYEKLPAKYK